MPGCSFVEKLQAPNSAGAVPRTRLMIALQARESRLTVLRAGPGFGKTALLAQLHRRLSGIKFWYRFDALDENPLCFLTALARLAGPPDHEYDINEARVSQPGLTRSLLVRVINGLDGKTSGPVFFFFDDYHAVANNSRINEGVELLIKHLPGRFHFFIASRTKPDLGLGRLRSQRKLVDIGPEELAFISAETSELLASGRNLPLLKKEITEWQDETRGWPAALDLCKPYICSRTARPSAALSLALARGGALRKYIEDEIITGLDPESAKALCLSSLTDPVEIPVCGRLIPGDIDLAAILKDMEAGSGLAIAENKNAYRLHPVFRAYLRRELQKIKTPRQISELHFRLAQEFHRSGNDHKAIDHFLEARSFEMAMPLIKALFKAGNESSSDASLERWLKLLPVEAKRKLADECQATIFQNKESGGEGAAGGIIASAGAVSLIRLTRREQRVFFLLAEKKSNAEIAGLLSICESTVKKHVSNIFHKTGITKRSQAEWLARMDL